MTKTKKIILLCVCFLFPLLPPLAAQTVDTLNFRINAGAGATLINLPDALEWDENYFDDWDKLNIKVNLQCEIFDFSSFRIGAEIGYNRFYYYYVRIPWVPSPLIYEDTVTAVNISALGTYILSDNIFVQGAIGPYFFGGGAEIGLKGAVGYRIPVGEDKAVPISFVADVIFGSGTPVSFGIAVGFEYKVKLSKSK